MTPSELVRVFIRAMNEWELNANATVRAAEKTGTSGSDALDRAALALANVLRSYCHSAAASLDGQMVYGRPAQFDPESEQVEVETVVGDLAFVETLRRNGLSKGRYRYHLRSNGAEWRVDAMDWLVDGSWQPIALPAVSQLRLRRAEAGNR